MGGKSTKIVYKTDRAEVNKQQAALDQTEQEQKRAAEGVKSLQRTISELRKTSITTSKRLRQLEVTKKERDDASRLRQNEEAMFANYLREIKKMAPSLIAKQKQARQADNRLVLAVTGKVSSGKSTLVNAILGRYAQGVGIGRLTPMAREVGSFNTRDGHTVRLVDVPGDDLEFNYLDLDMLEDLAVIDAVLIVYDNTPEYCSRFVRLASALGKHCIFVRNKVDDCDEDERSGESYVSEDKKLLSGCGISDPLISAVSGLNAYLSKVEAKKACTDESYVPKQYELYQWNKLMRDINHVAKTVAVDVGRG